MNSSEAISIIVPVLNEEKRIKQLVDSFRLIEPLEWANSEIIVVDGGSTDNTLDLCPQVDLIISSPPGRAIQQNRGAIAAQNNILLFLHADSMLTPGCLNGIRNFFRTTNCIAGCFSQTIEHSEWKYRLLEWGNRKRVQWFQTPYGDQGIFLKKETFDRAGQFPDVPFLEDLLLMKKLRKLGKVGILNEKLITSARRWEKNGVIKQTIKNRLLVTLNTLGFSPETLTRFYPPVR